MIFSLCFLVSVVSLAQEKLSTAIRLNQVGFYPSAKKIAVVANEEATEFYIASPDLKKKLLSGKLSDVKQSSFSPTKTKVADFSQLKISGTYIVVVPGLGRSYPFEIKPNVHEAVEKASLKAFYFQRFSMTLTEKYAGKWKRAAGPDHKNILIHASAVSSGRKEGDVMASSHGWIDAGDYNKYIVNSGISTSTLLSAYEDFPAYYDKLNVEIPESKNALPDILDETLWNLRWMLTMQDPADGGVYHKCTNAKFSGMVMPDKETTPRYVVMKSTAAALNFAAVTAQASRVFKKYSAQLPGLADSCLVASIRAWYWAKSNPEVVYDQNKMNESFDPDVSTGAYGDKKLSDEFFWAAVELTVSSGDVNYTKSIDMASDSTMDVPSWSDVKLLGYYTLFRNQLTIPPVLSQAVQTAKENFLKKAKAMTAEIDKRTYQSVMGATAKDFVWGSNAVAANQSILLIQAYKLQGDPTFLNGALSNLDYILGRNATGYSFVTGHGDKTPMHIHHRPSEADGITEPVPGLLAGGPNPGMQDKCKYASAVPDEAYVDDVCSYASNEIAINWNAPLVYLAGAMEALQNDLK